MNQDMKIFWTQITTDFQDLRDRGRSFMLYGNRFDRQVEECLFFGYFLCGGRRKYIELIHG
jgi:hypothetical protein